MHSPLQQHCLSVVNVFSINLATHSLCSNAEEATVLSSGESSDDDYGKRSLRAPRPSSANRRGNAPINMFRGQYSEFSIFRCLVVN